MSSVDKALETQLANIQTRAGKSMDELYVLLRASGLEKHGQIRTMLKEDLGMGHGDANTVAHFYLRLGEEPPEPGDVLDDIYTGPKQHLRPIHEALMTRVQSFGDFEIAPKKAYVSLRRKKQFATVGPATKTQVEVGLNMRDVPGTARLKEQKPGGMCQYKVRLAEAGEVDDELIGWIRRAYDRAG